MQTSEKITKQNDATSLLNLYMVYRQAALESEMMKVIENSTSKLIN
jgi:hypothetical protein